MNYYAVLVSAGRQEEKGVVKKQSQETPKISSRDRKQVKQQFNSLNTRMKD